MGNENNNWIEIVIKKIIINFVKIIQMIFNKNMSKK